jgi:hypothetical protein
MRQMISGVRTKGEPAKEKADSGKDAAKDKDSVKDKESVKDKDAAKDKDKNETSAS